MSVLCRCSIIIRTAIHGWQCLLTTSAKSEKEPRKKTSAIQVDGRPCRVCVVSRKMRSWLAWMSYMTDLAVGRNSSPITFDSLWTVTLDVSLLFFSPLLFSFALFYVCVVANNRFLPLTLFRHCFFFGCCSLLGVTLCAVPMFLHSRAKRGRSRGNQPNDSDLHNLPLRVSQRWWTCPLLFHPLGDRAYHHGSLVRVQPFCSLRLCCKGVSACLFVRLNDMIKRKANAIF